MSFLLPVKNGNCPPPLARYLNPRLRVVSFPQYGLYGSFLGCLVYILLGSCKDVPMGPTAITALLVYQSLHGNGPEFAVLLCFLTGVVQFLMGLLGLGKYQPRGQFGIRIIFFYLKINLLKN